MFPTLIPNELLRRRTAEMALQIAADYPDEPVRIVAVMEGAKIFCENLCRLLPGEAGYGRIRARSYEGTDSTGNVEVISEEPLDVSGQHVLLVEDIVDTGRTVAALREHFESLGAASVRVASLLSKPSKRVVDVAVDYIGFEIPDEFVIGYGMDLDGRYRELDAVMVYKPEFDLALKA